MTQQARVIVITEERRRERFMRRLQSIHESGQISWTLAMAKPTLRSRGLDTLDMDRLIETGSVLEEETLTMQTNSNEHQLVRKLTVAGFTVDGDPAQITVEVRHWRTAVVTSFEWL